MHENGFDREMLSLMGTTYETNNYFMTVQVFSDMEKNIFNRFHNCSGQMNSIIKILGISPSVIIIILLLMILRMLSSLSAKM